MATRAQRIGLWLATAALLAIGFAGWLHPDMQLAWASLLALCGF